MDGASRETGAVSLQRSRCAFKTLKDVERVFETLLHPDKRKTHGSVYTPSYIVAYLCREALAFSSQPSATICDPFCGSGGFLIGAADALRRYSGVGAAEAFSSRIVGIDTDPEALRNAALLCELYLLEQGASQVSELNLYRRDSLLSRHSELLTSVGHERGFDLIVTNPPYIKLQNLPVETRQQLVAAYADYAAGSFSLALLFLVSGPGLLADNGCLAAITQNNFFTSLAGRRVRERLQSTRAIHRIVDFGHQKVFAGAAAYTCLVFLGKREQSWFEYESLAGAALPAALDRCDFGQIPYSGLDSAKWRLAKPPHLANLRQLESNGAPLADLVHIRVGFATLKDSTFLVQEHADGNCYSQSPDGAAHTIEAAITRPAIKVATLSSEQDIVHSALRVIFPYEKRAGRYVLIEESRMMECFPGAYAYLYAARSILETRDKGLKQYAGWYAWGRTQGMDAVGPKLLTKTFDRGPSFFLDHTDSLFCNGYALTARSGDLFASGISLPVLQRVLNSRVFHYYARLTSFQIDGGYECYQKNFIERFCVPPITEERQRSLLADDGRISDAQLLELFEPPCGRHRSGNRLLVSLGHREQRPSRPTPVTRGSPTRHPSGPSPEYEHHDCAPICLEQYLDRGFGRMPPGVISNYGRSEVLRRQLVELCVAEGRGG